MQGQTGTVGQVGDDGDVGPQGAKGSAGAPGLPGPKGEPVSEWSYMVHVPTVVLHTCTCICVCVFGNGSSHHFVIHELLVPISCISPLSYIIQYIPSSIKLNTTKYIQYYTSFTMHTLLYMLYNLYSVR